MEVVSNTITNPPTVRSVRQYQDRCVSSIHHQE